MTLVSYRATGWCLVVLCACTTKRANAPDAPPDAFDPYAYVEPGNRIKGTWPNPMPITFKAADGAVVATEAVDAMTYRALLPAGGSVTLRADNSTSPTASNATTWSVDGLRPGDRLDFVDVPPPLPADCTSRSIAWTIDTYGNATWTDPDAAQVDARIASYYSATNCSMCSSVWSETTVDGSTGTTLANGVALKSVVVIACPDETYDDIRTIVGVGG